MPSAETRARRSAGRPWSALAWSLILLSGAGLAQDPPAAARTATADSSATPWLDEVRAQRQAWELRRQSAREAFEARRRLADPHGAAYQEDIRQRREARQQRLEQERERLRELGQPPAPWYAPAGPTSELPAQTPAGAPAPLLAPEHWGNLWYFRGY